MSTCSSIYTFNHQENVGKPFTNTIHFGPERSNLLSTGFNQEIQFFVFRSESKSCFKTKTCHQLNSYHRQFHLKLNHQFSVIVIKKSMPFGNVTCVLRTCFKGVNV